MNNTTPMKISHIKAHWQKERQRLRQEFLANPNRGKSYALRMGSLQQKTIKSLSLALDTKNLLQNSPSFCLMAVGGFGRNTLAPYSDIDLCVLVEKNKDAAFEQWLRKVLHTLWDMGLKTGHAVRTIQETIKQSRDITVHTALLDARYILGNRHLFTTWQKLWRPEHYLSPLAFDKAKLEERNARLAKWQGAGLLEPHIKEGVGGLRDAQTIWWIARHSYNAKTYQDLTRLDLLLPQELRALQRATRFLWSVRTALHFLEERANERLAFANQYKVAILLKFNGATQKETQKQTVEKFMRRYYMATRQIERLLRVVRTQIEQQHHQTTPHQKPAKTLQTFPLTQGGLMLKSHKTMKAATIMGLFHTAQNHHVPIHPKTLKDILRLPLSFKKTLRHDTTARHILTDILASPHNPEQSLRLLNEAGLLEQLVPDFGKIIAHMQFNMYHHYTVDEHIIRAVGFGHTLLRGDLCQDVPLATKTFAKHLNRKVLMMALFLHDIAKGSGKDHSAQGARIAKALCPAMNFKPQETDLVAWLVEHHLYMSTISQKRDILDPKTVRHFAATVQTLERLKLLFLLTVADIHAVGHGVWNAWKGNLLQQLYEKTQDFLQRTEHRHNPTKGQLEKAYKDFKQTMQGVPAAQVRSYIRRHTPQYWLSFSKETHKAHARLMERLKAKKQLFALDIKSDLERDATALTFIAPDHPGFFARLTGACAIANVNITDARIFTTRHGLALDVLWLQDTLGKPLIEKQQCQHLRKIVRDVMEGKTVTQEALHGYHRQVRRLQNFQQNASVTINNQDSNTHTLIEVRALDRPGLLYSLATELFHSNITISSAHIRTYGEVGEDVFYTQDLTGHKITNKRKLQTLEKSLMAVLNTQNHFYTQKVA